MGLTVLYFSVKMWTCFSPVSTWKALCTRASILFSPAKTVSGAIKETRQIASLSKFFGGKPRADFHTGDFELNALQLSDGSDKPNTQLGTGDSLVDASLGHARGDHGTPDAGQIQGCEAASRWPFCRFPGAIRRECRIPLPDL